MNDEIKEILDKLKDGNWYDELDLTGEMWIELRWEEAHLLLDYITKLQSNWNSLREELYQANRELVINELVNGKELINNIIDIMNELEGVDNENN